MTWVEQVWNDARKLVAIIIGEVVWTSRAYIRHDMIGSLRFYFLQQIGVHIEEWLYFLPSPAFLGVFMGASVRQSLVQLAKDD